MAGPTLATSVVPIPTMTLATIALVLITRSAAGNSRPDSITDWRTLAMPMPAAKPMRCRQHADGKRLGGNGEHDLTARCPDGPHQRGLTVRWATRIENVLWMLKAATTTAIPAKASSRVWKKPRKSLSTSRCCSAVSSAPVSASIPSGSVAAIRLECAADSVGSAHEHGGDRVGAPGEQLLAVSVSKATYVTPPTCSVPP